MFRYCYLRLRHFFRRKIRQTGRLSHKSIEFGCLTIGSALVASVSFGFAKLADLGLEFNHYWSVSATEFLAFVQMTLADYYSTNYSQCNVSYSFFASSKAMIIWSHLSKLVTYPLQLFVFYIIINYTPKVMKSMKIPLLICHSW